MHKIVLDDENAYIMHKATGRRVKLHKKGNAFVMKMQLLPPGDESTQQSAKENRKLLGALGFNRQEG